MLLHQTNMDLSQSATIEPILFLKQPPQKLSIFKLMSLVAVIGIVTIIVLLVR